VADESVPMVEANGIRALKPGHASHQVGIRGLQHQVIVVTHQAKGMYLPTSLLAGLGQGFEEVVPVNVIQKDVLTPVSATHDMVDGIWILNAQLARHFPRCAERIEHVNQKTKIYMG
jgi:hypothetical protein